MSIYKPQRKTSNGLEDIRFPLSAIDGLLCPTTSGDTLVWDGNTEGKTAFDMMGDGTYTYYLVSENVITLDDLANGLILETSDPTGTRFEEIELNDFAKMSNKIIASRSVSSVLFVLEDNATLYSATIPKKGIYFMKSTAYGYASKIKIEGYTGFNTDLEVINRKYIPKHLHSWDDITNKPEVINGEDGEDGVSATHSWSGTVLTITSASGTSSADLKGAKGDKGDTGATGATGANGKDGKTPVKGTDYFTSADKTEMVNAVISALPKYAGGVS